MKRTIFALLLTAATGISLYACTGDDSAASSGDDGGESDGGPTGDGSFQGDGSFTNDSGTDAGLNSTSAQILAVKNAAPATPDGGEVPSAVTLPIDHALVTYVRPAVLPDPAGFFLQAEQTGPAVFVAIDPATLSTPPVAGDDVSMTVTSVGNLVSLHEVLAVTGFKVNSHGNSIAGLLRPVSSATDLVSKLDNYESEYIQLDGFISGNFANSGGSKSAEIVTTAVSSPSTSLELRIPPAVQTFFDLENTCQFSLTGIMWRFGKGAEPSGWANADLTVTCDAPKVVSAIATSPTTVNVLFDRNIAASSIVAAGTPQFTINDAADGGAGVAVSGAVLSPTDPRTVTLTTSAQTAGQSLVVVVANTLEDVLAKPVDMAHNTADFLGYVTPATVRFSELSPQITGSHDLVELQVLTDGNLIGITIQENLVSSPVVLATLPNLQVVAGDLVVVHLNADLADGGAGVVIDESVAKTDCPADAGCYDTAWDVKDTLKSTKGLTAAGRVVVVKSPNGQIMDGISWYLSTSAVTASLVGETNALIDAGQWVGCGGTYCADTDAAAAISVDMKGTGTTAGGKSVQRVISIDSNTAADWAVDAGTFGFENN